MKKTRKKVQQPHTMMTWNLEQTPPHKMRTQLHHRRKKFN